MKTFLLLLFAFTISLSGYSQMYLGKTKEEIRKIADNIYDEVEQVAESSSSFKLLCDEEVNEFFIVDKVCVKFTSIKSYKCNCLATDLKKYNESLKPIGNMRWVSKDGTKLYEIFLDKSMYMVSITPNNDVNLAKN